MYFLKNVGKMKNKIISVIASAMFMVSCSTGKAYHEVKVNNPEFIPDTAFVGQEDLSSPKFKALKEKYQLDTIFHGETNELKRILLLRHWIHEAIRIDDYGPYAGNGSVESTIDEALKGHGFHCGYFSSVQNAILNAYGYVTRSILVDTGIPVDYMVGGGHHAVNEVWLNSYHKWFLSDAKYDYHFEKNGIPLSALEIRAEYLKNKAADIILVKGVEKKAVDGLPEYNIKTREQLARAYTWISWYKNNNRYTGHPDNSADIIMYQDDYFKTHTWLWDGKPHWAYNTKFLHLVADKDKIEWTPNTVSSKVLIEGSKAIINLIADTSNFKTYQAKTLPDVDWKDIPATVEWDLKKEKNEMIFRTMNLAGVAGPEHKIIIEQ